MFLENLWSKIILYQMNKEKDTDFQKCFVKIPYVGIDSKWFANCSTDLIQCLFGIKLQVIFVTVKINRYFQLKSKTPRILGSTVVYQFRCSCDTNLSCIGMSTRHWGKELGDVSI